MRVEPFGIGSYVHALRRGGRDLPIYRKKSDLWRYLRALYYMNNETSNPNWARDTEGLEIFAWPEWWSERKKLTSILCFTLMPNHLHYQLKEIQEGGVSGFMKKSGESINRFYNEKYHSHGSLFQGGYKSKTIDSDLYLKYLAVYIMVKNVFELFPRGGLRGAVKNFEEAWKWAKTYPFSSFWCYAEGKNSPIIDKEVLGEVFADPKQFKAFSKDIILGRKWEKDKDKEFNRLIIESL